MNSGIPTITVQNAQRTLRVDVKALRRFAERAIRESARVKTPPASHLEKLAEVHVVLVSDARMAALHKQFMDIEGATDVLTFQHGEIFISVETARENAVRFKTTAAHEIMLYLVHGILHLHGFDDRTAQDAHAMATLQDRIVAAARSSRTADGGPV